MSWNQPNTQSSCTTQSCLHGMHVPVADLHCQENVSGLQNHTEKGRWLERSCSCWAVPPSWLPSEKTTDEDDKYPAVTPEHQVPATTSLLITTSTNFVKPFLCYITCLITRKHKIDETLADQTWKQNHAIERKQVVEAHVSLGIKSANSIFHFALICMGTCTRLHN